MLPLIEIANLGVHITSRDIIYLKKIVETSKTKEYLSFLKK